MYSALVEGLNHLKCTSRGVKSLEAGVGPFFAALVVKGEEQR